MRRLLTFTTLLAAITLAPTLGADARAQVRVVATLADLGALAAAVGGDRVQVTTLARATEDPHYVDPRPSHLLPLSRADLVIFNGLELEIGWLPPLLVNARNASIQPGGLGYLDASTLVTEKLNVPAGRIDRAQGDIHPGGNPHFTHDPRRAAEIALGIAARLAVLDEAHAATYRANGERVAAELRAFAREARARFDALPPDRRQVVVYHDSWVYLVDWLGLEQVATIEERPGIRPSPGHVSRVLSLMRQSGARVILQERFYPRRTSETLARLAGAHLLLLPGGAAELGGEGYLAHVRANADALLQALSNG